MPAQLASHGGQPYTFRISPAAMAMVVAAHAGVALLLTASRALPTTSPQSPLMVEVITAEVPMLPGPKAIDITPPKPKPVVRQERVTHAQDVPMLEAKALQPASLPPTQTPPAPVQAAPAAHAVPVASAPASPRFDADYLDNAKPVYPPISRREREQGKVLLHVYVEASGAAGKVELGTGSGYERLDKAALAAVSRWRFVPARQGSEAMAAWVTVPIIFSLKD